MTCRILPILFASALPALAQTPAFPGAEGYGAYAKGGRGGDVYHVTNLNASGAGSFIEGINTVPSAGRTIVFDVSGYIRFPSGSGGTRMTASKVTIAGQTAPGDGIGFYNNAFRISGDDVIVRHLRFRLGKYGSGGDCLNLDSGSVNSILDHLSVQFSTDENISSFSSPPENLTLQYSLNAWGLESHSCGGLWDQNHATSHHNLWAHNHTRNPKARPAGLLEWINNVTFDWDIGFIMGDSDTPATWKSNVIGNYYICPPGNIRSRALEKANLDRNGNPNFSLHMSGNYYDGNGNSTLDGALAGYGLASGTYITSASPFSSTGSRSVAVDAAPVAYKKVVSNAGALRLDASYGGEIRDEVDTILLSKLVNLQRAHITRESDTGASAAGFGVLNSSAAPVDTDQDGMPDFYETALGWNATSQDHNTALANSGGLLTGTTFMPAGTVSGYNRLEEYLHYLSIPHGSVAKNVTGAPTGIAVDLRKFTSGFSSTPTFAVSNITGGAIVLSGTGNSIATFTPTLNYVGRGRFDFTVTDSAGHAWTQTFAVLVANAGLPRDLNWKGDGSINNWDIATNNWLIGTTPSAFSSGDRATFTDSGSLSPAVNVIGTQSPSTMDVNATGNYNFAGTGSIGSGTLTKRGTGTLTFSNSAANSFSGVMLDSGTIVAGRTDSLGTGNVAFGDSTLNLPGGGGTFTSPLSINGSSTLNWTSNSNMYFSSDITGAGQLNLNFSSKLFTLQGSWANFTGTLNNGSSTGTLRINSYGTNDFSKMRFHMGNAWLRHHLNGALGVSFGELNATSGAHLTGGDTNYAVTDTYTIGALNTDSDFGGIIADGSGTNHKLGIAKTGTGSLFLSGVNTHTGPTNVNAGSVIVSGSIGNSAVTVASGALLAGGGTFGGGVTAGAGSFLSPGTAPFTGATMTVNGGLSLNGGTLYFDMSATPGGANDRITMGGGALSMTGNQYFQFLLLQNTLASGTYDLITGASTISAGGYTLGHNLPTGTRQTFDLAAVGTSVRLTVTGDPVTLTWTGGTSANWDAVTANNWTGASPNIFGFNDAVVFDDSTVNRSVTLVGSLVPRTIVVNTTAGYTLTGTGTIDGAGSLVKNGTGTLWLGNASASTFTGGFTLNAGTIAFQTDAASNAALGAGPVTMNGGTLSMFSNFSSYDNFTAALVVPATKTATLNADSRVDIYGSLSGAGTLNFSIPSNRTSLYANWAGFTGILNATTSSGYAELRMSQDYNPSGFPNATVNLGSNIVAVFTGNINQGAGTTIGLGSLSGPASSKLLGGPDFAGSRLVTYRIGGKGEDVTFAGKIEEQNPAVTNTSSHQDGRWHLDAQRRFHLQWRHHGRAGDSEIERFDHER